jgi:hypothetical protein
MHWAYIYIYIYICIYIFCSPTFACRADPGKPGAQAQANFYWSMQRSQMKGIVISRGNSPFPSEWPRLSPRPFTAFRAQRVTNSMDTARGNHTSFGRRPRTHETLPPRKRLYAPLHTGHLTRQRSTRLWNSFPPTPNAKGKLQGAAAPFGKPRRAPHGRGTGGQSPTAHRREA